MRGTLFKRENRAVTDLFELWFLPLVVVVVIKGEGDRKVLEAEDKL